MTLREGIRKYPKAIGWSVLLSLAVVMEGHGVYKLRTEIPIEWLLIHQIYRAHIFILRIPAFQHEVWSGI